MVGIMHYVNIAVAPMYLYGCSVHMLYALQSTLYSRTLLGS